jgi:hypothetical protein
MPAGKAARFMGKILLRGRSDQTGGRHMSPQLERCRHPHEILATPVAVFVAYM